MTALARGQVEPRKFRLYAALGVCAGVAVWLASYVPAADWHMYYGAARAALDGCSPYVQPIFVNPPWTVLLLAPFALFPPNLGRGLLLVCSVAIWLYVAWRMRAPKVAVIAMLLSPTAIGSLLAANLDAFVLLGVFLPAAWGFLVLMIKPQIGVGPVVYDLIDVWHRRGITGVLLTLAPVVAAYAASAVLFPIWADRFLHAPADVWNRSLFPYGVPLGIFLLWLSFRFRNVMFALAATPFFSPYLTFYTYLVVQIGLLNPEVERFVPRVWLQLGLCVFLWAIMLLFRL